jgi:hypothetical protein
MNPVDPFSFLNVTGKYLSGDEKKKLVDDGTVFTIHSVSAVDDPLYGRRLEFTITLNGEIRVLTLGSTPVRETFAAAVRDHLPVDVRLVMGKTATGRQFYTFERA